MDSCGVSVYLFCLFIHISMAVMSIANITPDTHHVWLLWIQDKNLTPCFSLIDQEYQRLKVGMETLLASNDEKVKLKWMKKILNIKFKSCFDRNIESLYLCIADKQDRRIEELTILLGQYRKMREVMALAQGTDYILTSLICKQGIFSSIHPIYCSKAFVFTNQGAVKRS